MSGLTFREPQNGGIAAAQATWNGLVRVARTAWSNKPKLSSSQRDLHPLSREHACWCV